MFGRTLDHLSLLCIPILFIRDNENTCLWCQWKCNYCSVAKLCLTLCNPMDYSVPLSPRVFSNSCPLNRWCHPTISSSVVPISSCPQSFQASGFFPMSCLFESGGQGTGASASVLPLNIQGWFPLGLTDFILLSMGLSRVFSSATVWKHQFLSVQPSLWSKSNIGT